VLLVFVVVSNALRPLIVMDIILLWLDADA
jgi:hypothetical protein